MDYFLLIVNRIFAIREIETIFQLVLIVLLAGIVGYERESWKKPAGFRTYVLVGISSVLVMICGKYIFTEIGGSDPTRIPAQLLSGIGFLGAGTILRDGFNVKGLTTAAALLAVTCIGMAVGAGYYVGAIIATIIVYLVLGYSHVLSDKLEHFATVELVITSSDPKSILPDLQQVFTREKLEMINCKILETKEDDGKIRVVLRHKDKIELNKVMSKALALPTVKAVDELAEID